MTAQQLKNSILQIAVQGKLVPQDPNDEPASILLERIRAEKEEMIKEGKIKKEKNPSVIFRGDDNLFYEKVGDQEPVCIADEVPFEIPESWEWVRLGNITNYGQTKQKINAKEADRNLWQLDLEDIEKDSGRVLTVKSVGERNATGVKTVFHKGDILYSKLRPYLLKILVAPADGICTSEIVPFSAPGDILGDYLVYYLKAPYADFYVNSHTYGVKMPRVGTDTMISLFVPIPPKKEQMRILDALNNVEPCIEKYGNIDNKLSALNIEFPETIKKSILQMAVQGKLVPQNPNDEPASVLLERIHAEKEQLIQSGKIKRDKHESFIYRRDGSYYEKVDGMERCIDNEIPFDIPASWEWVRLGNITNYGQTKQKINAKEADRNLWQLDLEDIEKDSGQVLTVKSVGERSATGDKTVFHKGDILFSKLRPYLLKILVAPADGICTSEIVPFSAHSDILEEYLVYYLKSPYVEFYINSHTYGVKMPRVGTDTMISLFVPIPPSEEQFRIVNNIEKLSPLVDSLCH